MTNLVVVLLVVFGLGINFYSKARQIFIDESSDEADEADETGG